MGAIITLLDMVIQQNGVCQWLCRLAQGRCAKQPRNFRGAFVEQHANALRGTAHNKTPALELLTIKLKKNIHLGIHWDACGLRTKENPINRNIVCLSGQVAGMSIVDNHIQRDIMSRS